MRPHWPRSCVVGLVLLGLGLPSVEGRGPESEAPAPAGIEFRVVDGGAGLSGRVLDASSGEPLPGRIVVHNEGGDVVATRYERLPGVFTEEDGTFTLDLPPGDYSVEAHHGIDYVSERGDFQSREGAGVEAVIRLQPWVPLREMGWVNGDAHAHLYTDESHDDPMLETVRRICRAQGVDFIAACQGWGGYGDDDWREGFSAFSDGAFHLLYGAEMPKYRTGHTFWLGIGSTRGYFRESMDETYENEYYQVARNPEWSFDSLPFPSIPDVELVPRLKEAERAAALVPHPTSWWWQERDGVEKYTTNVASHLAFGLLSGGLWDGLVVMGYEPDRYFYQNLWFHVLNEGYRMTPVAELDGGYEPGSRFYYGAMRTYLHAGPRVDRDSLVQAVEAGHTFVTSGPIVLASIADRYQPGDVIPADGTARTLRVRAYASGDREDHLTYVVLFRDGRIHRLWDLREARPRSLEAEVGISERGNAWYVVKAYGRRAPDTPEALDVMTVCDRIVAGKPTPAPRKDSDVALTSPFYFRSEGAVDPEPLTTRVRLRVMELDGGTPVTEGTVTIQLLGRAFGTHDLREGELELEMPVNALLVIEVPGHPALRRSLYLDYRPHRDLIERLASGRWLEAYGGKGSLQPGQVPWEAFQLDEARAVLSDVDWTVPLEPNERDGLWDRFEGLFE